MQQHWHSRYRTHYSTFWSAWEPPSVSLMADSLHDLHVMHCGPGRLGAGVFFSLWALSCPGLWAGGLFLAVGHSVDRVACLHDLAAKSRRTGGRRLILLDGFHDVPPGALHTL